MWPRVLRGRQNLAVPVSAFAAAAPAPTLDSGDTAWMLTSSLLVLLMTLPGLALFYGGLVRAKNVLSVLMQCFAIVSLVTILWVVYGYSLAFSTQGMVAGTLNFHSFFGGLDRAFLAGLTRDSLTLTVPESVFAMFQLTFAAITPALIVGAFAERVRFWPLMLFVVLWFTFGYLPVAHLKASVRQRAVQGTVSDCLGHPMPGVAVKIGNEVVEVEKSDALDFTATLPGASVSFWTRSAAPSPTPCCTGRRS